MHRLILLGLIPSLLLGDEAEVVTPRQVKASEVGDSVELVGATGLPLGRRFTIEAKLVQEERKHHKDTDRRLIVIRALDGRLLDDHLKLALWEGSTMREGEWLTLEAYEEAAYAMVDILPNRVDPTHEGLLVQRLSTGVIVLGPAKNPAGAQQGDQDGAEQPSTQPESKPESGGKPQPEAEDRSR